MLLFAQIVQVVVFVVVQRRFPMVQTVLRTMQLPQLQFIDKVFYVPVCAGPARFGCSWRGELSRSHSCSSSFCLDTVGHMPVVCTTVAVGFRVQNTLRSCSALTRVNGDFFEDPAHRCRDMGVVSTGTRRPWYGWERPVAAGIVVYVLSQSTSV